ncbi:hypothetical protein [Streptomyces sp. SudanB25_2051]|uniref:hypothetical protein n=1 Tax=Streptomyces sp. SudanB25_2051 TaxID=3035275 RepID=UPI003F5685C8
MPRPTAARLALGSATVVCSTVILLLLTGATSDAAIALSATLSLLLGVAVAAPPRAAAGRGAGPADRGHAGHAPGPHVESRAHAGADTAWESPLPGRSSGQGGARRP